MKKNMKFGLSLISLIITVIVIIILTAIVVFSGSKTPDRANFAKFVEDISCYKTSVTEDFMKKKTNYALESKTRTDEQIYYAIATGNEALVDVNTNPQATGLIKDLNIDIYPEKLNGTKYFEITSDININGIKKQYYFFEQTEKHYITDKGEVFILPGYLVFENDSEKWYINERKYYSIDSKISFFNTYSVGDYVDYSPKENEYIPTEETTGAMNEKLKTDMISKWRIIYIDNKNNELYITPGVVNSSEKLFLFGTSGYFNSISELNNICETLYSNSDKGITAKNISIEDINKICDYKENICNGYKYYLKAYEVESNSGEIVDGVLYTASPTIMKKRFFTGIGGSTKYYNNIPYQAPAEGNPVYVKNTSYSYDYPSNDIKEIINIQNIKAWIAGNCVDTQPGYASYCTFVFDKNGINYIELTRSSGWDVKAERRLSSNNKNKS